MDELLLWECKDGVLTVQLPKDIDHHVAKIVRGRIDEMLERLHPGSLLLDLTRTQFMDSSGLGLVLGRARVTQERGIDYQLINPNRATMKILEMAGVDRMLSISRI